MPGKWRTRELAVMRELGLRPTKGSGCTWLEKEDGESEDVIVQLKSTEGKSITVQRRDIVDLLYHAAIAHKIPVFVLDFVGDFMLIAVRRAELRKVAKALGGGAG